MTIISGKSLNFFSLWTLFVEFLNIFFPLWKSDDENDVKIIFTRGGVHQMLKQMWLDGDQVIY